MPAIVPASTEFDLEILKEKLRGILLDICIEKKLKADLSSKISADNQSFFTLLELAAHVDFSPQLLDRWKNKKTETDVDVTDPLQFIYLGRMFAHNKHVLLTLSTINPKQLTQKEIEQLSRDTLNPVKNKLKADDLKKISEFMPHMIPLKDVKGEIYPIHSYIMASFSEADRNVATMLYDLNNAHSDTINPHPQPAFVKATKEARQYLVRDVLKAYPTMEENEKRALGSFISALHDFDKKIALGNTDSLDFELFTVKFRGFEQAMDPNLGKLRLPSIAFLRAKQALAMLGYAMGVGFLLMGISSFFLIPGATGAFFIIPLVLKLASLAAGIAASIYTVNYAHKINNDSRAKLRENSVSTSENYMIKNYKHNASTFFNEPKEEQNEGVSSREHFVIA